MDESLQLRRAGPVAGITFNRPDKANAMDTAWFEPIIAFLDAVEADPGVRCVVIGGAGKHFMAGGDLELLQALSKQPPAQRAGSAAESIAGYNRMATRLRTFRKPIIASVQGGIAGSAVGLVAACDFVVAADNAFFFLAHVNLGSSSDGLATWFLPRQIGPRKTLELAVLGDRLSATDAKGLGLVNFVVPAPELEAETMKLANRLAAGPTRAYGLMKQLVEASLGNTLAEQGELEARCYREAASSDDFVEGVTAVLQKRAANFKGS